MLWGPRQVGKTTLLDQLELSSRLFLDDLALRTLAQQDPAALLETAKLPCLIDEAQYAPNLFPEIKLRIDRARRERLKKGGATRTVFYLTGSNRTLLDRQVQESLAGRSHLFHLYGLSINEVHRHDKSIHIKEILFNGGFPQLYLPGRPSIRSFLDEYILSFIEKDIVLAAGIEKRAEFQTVLKLIGARSGQFLNTSEISGHAGVDVKTVQSWLGLLERNGILALVPPYVTNLSKRITKMKKLYFIDTGLCARIQGHQSAEMLWGSPQAGALFESLVFSEILKTKTNFLKEWDLFTFRTKANFEIDFVLVPPTGKPLLIEAKMGIHGASPILLDAEAKKVFGDNVRRVVVTLGGEKMELGQNTLRLPVTELSAFLLGL
ncbi:MAG: ATP-binding protein [Bdellovibrionaceae bacterium]|nr:ATP-binding protein [Pseudobdellovibrionaceae bacterium]